MTAWQRLLVCTNHEATVWPPGSAKSHQHATDPRYPWGPFDLSSIPRQAYLKIERTDTSIADVGSTKGRRWTDDDSETNTHGISATSNEKSASSCKEWCDIKVEGSSCGEGVRSVSSNRSRKASQDQSVLDASSCDDVQPQIESISKASRDTLCVPPRHRGRRRRSTEQHGGSENKWRARPTVYTDVFSRPYNR